MPGRAGRAEAGRGGSEAAERVLAGEPVEQVLDPADPAAWIEFDAGVRDLPWRYGRPALGAQLRERPETALCHPDGRVRQQALTAAAAEPRLLPAVVIRCADWAEPVRNQARRILRAALEEDRAGTLAALTPLVLRLGERVHGAWALDFFEQDLRTAPYEPLAALRDSSDRKTRRFAARITLDLGLFDAREAARQAVAAPDPAMQQLWANAALAAMAADGPDDLVVDTLLAARSTRLRAAGVTALRRAGRSGEAAGHLLDRAAPVRACARWLLRQDGGDPRACYLDLLPHPEAVLGLAECTQRGEAGLLRELLTHPEGEVRAAAVTGLHLLEAALPAELGPLLDDPSPAVARATERALRTWADRLPAGELTARLAPDRPAHTRRAAFRLLRVQGGMPLLRATVLLLDDPERQLRERAVADLRCWDWQYSLRYEGGDRRELAELLHRSAAVFDAYELELRRSRLGLTG
ncbi:hypothetical protein DEJ50_27240 [Streptomyces venezuelae]|uniref:HEAT repeat domain-containing protein n=1 Tax=Streptomyces venezuelae TaxID=54571 RepID=A0A5P2D725_STRVZ|nr:hypothetical protein DEJ50_27240 [Streptomyces venezuelae]